MAAQWLYEEQCDTWQQDLANEVVRQDWSMLTRMYGFKPKERNRNTEITDLLGLKPSDSSAAKKGG